MIYELRVYEAMPGRMEALNQRFANHTDALFKKHGIRVVGYWTDMVGSNNKLTYLCAFDSMEDMQERWASFLADPEWHRVRDESERGGPLIARIHNKIWRPTSYSALQ